MSKNKECPSCGLEVSSDAKTCRYCGYEFPESSIGKRIVVAVLIVLLLIWMFSGIFF